MLEMRTSKTYKLALLGILSAIIVIQNFVPFLGYIPIQPFNPTIIHITVIVGAVVLGPAFGAGIGLVWGLVCLFRAFAFPTSPVDPIVFTNPMISVIPRVLVGVVAGYVFVGMKKLNSNKVLSAAVCGVVGSFTNTILVLGAIYVFCRVPYANYFEMDVSKLLPALLGVVATNGVAEAIAAGIITPLIVRPLMLIYKDI